MQSLSMTKLKSLSFEEIVELTDEEPFIAFFFHQSVVEENSEMPFAAGVYVSAGRPHLMLNPEKMNTFSTREKIGVLVHEYLHVSLSHCTKRSSHVQEFHKIENIAKDMAINQLIVDPKYGNWDLPEGCVSHTDPRINLPAGLTAEEYFLRLREKFSPDQAQQMFGDGLDDHSNWSSEDDPTGTKIIKEMAKRYLTSKGGKRGRTLRAGSHADSLIEEILTVETFDIDWKTKTRMWMHRIVDNKPKFTYKRFSRRYGMPFQGTKYRTKNKILAIVDTSGSMSEGFLSHIGGQLNLMTRIMQIDVVFCDAEVHGGIKKYKPTSQLKFPGRGGTDMQPGFDFAEEEGYRGIVCFTDGYLFREPQSKITTLWVVANNTGFTPPFGQVAHVKWEE